MKYLPIIIALLLTVTACTKKESNVIKVGAAGPFTGELEFFGQDQLNGVKLAVADWNAKGGVLGKKIVIVEGDDGHDPKKAVTVANKLVKQGVVGVIGHLNSGSSLVTAEIYNKAGQSA